MFNVRSKFSSKDHSVDVSTFKETMQKKNKRKVISWGRKSSNIRVVDVDLHKTVSSKSKKETLTKIFKLVSSGDLRPFAFQITKSMGIHLFFSGVEEASVAYFVIAKLGESNITGIEVLTGYTNYGDIKKVGEIKGDIKVTSLINKYNCATLPIDVDKERVNKYLPNTRLPHSDCPFEPDSNTRDQNKSVSVNENGVIHCYRCNKSTTVDDLKQGKKINLYKEYAKKLYPFSWAKYEFKRDLQARGVSRLYVEDYCKDIYRACLREMGHISEDKYKYQQIGEYCFSKEIDIFLSIDDIWIHGNGKIVSEKNIKAWLGRLPFLQSSNSFTLAKEADKLRKSNKSQNFTIDAQGKEVPRELLPEDFPLAKLGLYASKSGVENLEACSIFVEPFPRFKFIKGFDLKDLRESVPYPTNYRDYEVFRSKYEFSQLEDKDPLTRIKESFETIKRVDHLTFLPEEQILTGLLACLWSQLGLGASNPLVGLTGVSGAGKTTSIGIISHILGSKYESTEGNKSPTKILLKCDSVTAKGVSLMLIDEGFKHTEPHTFLTLSDRYRDIKILYRDPYNAELRMATFLTGVSLPTKFQSDKQFMRRCVMCPPLPFAQEPSSIKHLFGDERQHPDLRIACDSLILACIEIFEDFTFDKISYFGEFKSFMDMIKDTEKYDGLFDKDFQNENRLSDLSCTPVEADAFVNFIEELQDEKLFSGKKGKKADQNRYLVPKESALGLDIGRMETEFYNEKDWSKITGVKELRIEVKDAVKKNHYAITFKIGRKLFSVVNEEIQTSYKKIKNIL